MNDFTNYSEQSSMQDYQIIPYAKTSLWLGVCSLLCLILCCVPYISLWVFPLSIILPIITLVLVSQGRRTFNATPERYDSSGLSDFKTAQTCAIISLLISLLVLVIGVLFVTIIGMEVIELIMQANGDQEEINRIIEEWLQTR